MNSDNEKLNHQGAPVEEETQSEVFGQQTVYVSDEDVYDESRPFLQDGFDEEKARRRQERIKSGKPARVSSIKIQTRWICILLVAALLLGVAYSFVDAFVKTIVYTDEIDGTRYFIKQKPNPDYDKTDSTSKKKLYYLCDKEGNVLTVTPDGYYSTAAGTLVDVDSDTGEYETIAIVDTEGTEEIGANRRVLIFPHTEKKNIKSIEVNNEYGSYTFYRDENNEFQIKGYDGTQYSQELLSYLVTSTGYTLTLRKIEDPIKDENGEFTEYGLVPETRVDGEGNEYQYTPANYVLTDTSGNVRKVIVGDKLITDGGYYVQYDGRDAVYVVSTTIEKTVLQPIEELVTPMAAFPMSVNNYFDVENFSVVSFDYDKYRETGVSEDIISKTHIVFTYVDIALRENTEYSSYPYVMGVDVDGEVFMDGYTPSPNAVEACLQSMRGLKPSKTVRLGTSEAAIKKYGLDEPKYLITYIFRTTDEETGKTLAIPNYIMLSDKNEDGSYYAVSLLYDMIVEIPATQLMFLENKDIDWIDENVLSVNLGHVERIALEHGDYVTEFLMDNSESDVSETVVTDRIKVTAKENGGEEKHFTWGIDITDSRGFNWVVDTKSITAKDKSGAQVPIKNIYTTKNKFGNPVQVVDGWITDTAGNSVSVGADIITFKDYDGTVRTFERSALYNFRQFYKVLLYINISGDLRDYTTDEEIEALKNVDDSKCQLKITIELASGNDRVFRFYRYSERKSLMTINGEGTFFVSAQMVEKLAQDASKVVAGEVVKAEAKY